MAATNGYQNGARTNSNGEVLEKDFSQTTNNGAEAYHMNDVNMPHGDAIKRIQTAGSISISPELFEKLYLSPQNNVKGDLRKTFGNPTPLYVIFSNGLDSQANWVSI